MSQGASSRERRRHPRAPLSIPATLLAPRAAPVRCAVENLSAGGALLNVPVPVDHEGPLRVRLRLGGGDVYATARVVRRRSGVNGDNLVAVAFRDVSPSNAKAIARAVECASAPVRVLVVDDDEVVRGALVRELWKLGASAFQVGTLAAAVDELADMTASIDVAVVDARLAPGDGLALLRHIATEQPQIRRVLMSGLLSAAERMRAQTSGVAEHVIEKPWAHADLERILRPAT